MPCQILIHNNTEQLMMQPSVMLSQWNRKHFSVNIWL